ncbi:hypothetical protein CPB86DRAFT_821723 [Serendipita vermifera]|nr:hypothetical protein CPB86DRAFT_821723 [Serendipita vermifera]
MLPTELYQTILRYSISVPDFLDPYAVDHNPYWLILEDTSKWNDVKPYWAAERTRNSLRRVCRSWSYYLGQHEHRFVRMVDVVHGIVAPNHLQSAVRIWFGGHHHSICEHCKPELYWFSGAENSPWSGQGGYPGLYRRILQQTNPLKVEILDFGELEADLRQIWHEISPSAFANVVILSASWLVDLTTLSEIINSLPMLRHCATWASKYFDTVPVLKSSTFKSLVVPFVPLMAPPDLFTQQKFYLPGLTHLHIWEMVYFHPRQACHPSLWAFLKVVGKTLTFLRIGGDSRLEIELPSEVWDFCPKLEFLHTALQPRLPPPSNHPLHTLGLPYSYVEGPDPLSYFIPNWPGIRTIRLGSMWDEEVKGSLLQSIDPRLRVEDVSGESYAEFILRTASKSSTE